MSYVFVVLLVALWVWILGPGALRSRRSSSPLESVSAFEHSMSVIAPLRSDRAPGRHVLVLSHPASVTGGSPRARLVARRRVALIRLSATTVVMGGLAVVLGGVFTVLFGLSLLVLTGFVVALVEARQRSRRARRRVHRLPVQARPVVTRDAYAHRRSA